MGSESESESSGFDWEGFADLIKVEVGVVDAFAFNFAL